jgi:PAS domain S-box-containing protein
LEQALKEGQTWRGELENRRKNGDIYWESVSISPVPDVDDTTANYIAVMEDITAQKRLEKELRETEHRLRNIVEHSTNLFYIHDTNRVFTYVSPQSRQFFDCEPEEAATHWAEFNRAAAAATQRAIDTGIRQPPHEVEAIGRQGRRIWVEVNEAPIVEDGKTVAIIGSLTDVTQRKATEKALLEEKEKFAKAFQAVPSLLIISTLTDGRYVEVNEAFEQRIGYRREEILGQSSHDVNIWHEQLDRARVVDMLQSGQVVRDQEISFHDRSGTPFLGLYSGQLLEINGEQCLLSLVSDITARRQAEEKIDILNTTLAARAVELEMANRELEAFSYSVSHDLRIPLTAISGYSEILLEQCCDDNIGQCRSHIQEMHDSALRMNGLIDSILDFSHVMRTELCREVTDLSSMAREVATELQLAEPERRATIRIAEGMTVTADPNLTRVVLENLLGNAWKYTGMREEACIEIGMTLRDGKTVCFVRDNGAGFKMAHAEKLFTPFHRLPGAEKFKGHGIGLATVERIVKRHGGKVWAEGEPGVGATFYFCLGGEGITSPLT